MLSINNSQFPRTDAEYPYYSKQHDAWFDLVAWDDDCDLPIVEPRFFQPAGDSRPQFWD